MVALAGHFDLGIPYPQEFDRQSVVALLGGTADEVPDAYRDASPRTWVDADSAAFLIMHGGADDMNPVAYIREMVDALHEAEVATVYAEFPEADHFTIADWAVAGPWTMTFFDRQLHPEG